VEIPDMNAATKPTKFLEAAWKERWIASEGGQHPNDGAVVQLQQLDSPKPDAMTFAENGVPCSAW